MHRVSSDGSKHLEAIKALGLPPRASISFSVFGTSDKTLALVFEILLELNYCFSIALSTYYLQFYTQTWHNLRRHTNRKQKKKILYRDKNRYIKVVNSIKVGLITWIWDAYMVMDVVKRHLPVLAGKIMVFLRRE